MSGEPLFAYIPARGGSTRLPRKNIKPLGGVPVLKRVIDSLRQTSVIGVGVSTEDEDIARLADEAGAETLALRAPDLADSVTGFKELVRGDVPRFMDHFGSRHVLFSLATAGLVTPEIFQAAIDLYWEKRPGLLLAVTRYPISPFWAMVEDEANGGWKPLFPEISRLPSPEHPKTVVDCGLFLLFDQERCKDAPNLLEVSPLEVFEVPEWMAVDVDTPEDWEVLERRYAEALEAGRIA